jgi:hypothetical protein
MVYVITVLVLETFEWWVTSEREVFIVYLTQDKADRFKIVDKPQSIFQCKKTTAGCECTFRG